MASKCTRPILRWHGGKWVTAPWIIAHFGPHHRYVEPFGGAWSVGFRKDPAEKEVWNDLDAELVNLMSVLRGRRSAKELIRQVSLTPFARDEFLAAYEPAEEPIERARRLLVRSFMGHGSDGASGQYRTGFRCSTSRAGPSYASEWAGMKNSLWQAAERLAQVIIENRPAIEVMAKHDAADTLHYVDPPYLPSTRARSNRRTDNGGVYRHELSHEQHLELLAFLMELEGMVVLSGYPSEIYDTELEGWMRVERPALKDGGLPATEVLWLNERAQAALGAGPLFR